MLCPKEMIFKALLVLNVGACAHPLYEHSLSIKNWRAANGHPTVLAVRASDSPLRIKRYLRFLSEVPVVLRAFGVLFMNQRYPTPLVIRFGGNPVKSDPCWLK